MLRIFLLIGLAWTLVACQTAPAPRDYDQSRDFTRYRTWTWAEPAVVYRPADDPRIQSDLTTQRIREAVSGQLDARGLRPAQPGVEPDLQVRAYMMIDQRQDNVTTSYGRSQQLAHPQPGRGCDPVGCRPPRWYQNGLAERRLD